MRKSRAEEKGWHFPGFALLLPPDPDSKLSCPRCGWPVGLALDLAGKSFLVDFLAYDEVEAHKCVQSSRSAPTE